MKTWKILSEEEVFAAHPFLRVVKQAVSLPDGRVIDDFYQVKLRTYAIVVPVTPEGEVVTIDQYKHGPGRVGISFPAGFVEAGEEPAKGAARELLEETGFDFENLIPLGTYVDNGNQRGCEGHQFLATGCRWVQDAQSGDLEQMEVRLRHPEDLDRAMAEGRLGVMHDVAAWGMVRTLHRDVFG
ncbi:NUDIX hydrolase [Thalassococcus sp. S3]|uniref:NUDIX hydrolase n=1 Tax=Thalassococcus sp. S3 TaxID=2017482 RepID=UPI0013EEB6C3|nr:NUDIX hydrolase [Thalassococcus sp. S3]